MKKWFKILLLSLFIGVGVYLITLPSPRKVSDLEELRGQFDSLKLVNKSLRSKIDSLSDIDLQRSIEIEVSKSELSLLRQQVSNLKQQQDEEKYFITSLPLDSAILFLSRKLSEEVTGRK